MAARAESFGAFPRQAWALFRFQIVSALSWASALVALEEAQSRHKGWRHGLFGAVRLGLRAAGGAVWFSIGWLGVAEYNLTGRQVALAGGFVGAVAAVCEALARMLRLRFAPLREGERKRRGEAFAFLPLIVTLGALLGAGMAALGAREAHKRG